MLHADDKVDLEAKVCKGKKWIKLAEGRVHKHSGTHKIHEFTGQVRRCQVIMKGCRHSRP
jgi:hypothetical protein